MSPAENKRAKRRKNKKGRLSNTQVASKSNEFNEMAPVDDMPEIDISEIKDRFCQGLDMRTSTVSSEKIICIKCHRPQTNSDLQKSSSKLGEYSAGLLEGFRVSRDLHLCDEKKIELGIPDPLWLCEDCENFLLPPENKVTYNSYRRHDLRQPHSLLRVETEMLRERENELLNTTIFEAQMDNSADMVSLMGTPMANTATNSGACLCAACCERKQVENEEEEECRELKRGWLDIKAYLHKVYKEEGLYLSEPHTNSSSGASIGESSLIDYLTQSLTKKKKATQNPSIETLKEWVHRLCKQDPQHLFLCLESQVKLFISEMRSRLLSLLKHLPDSCKGMTVDRAVEGNGIEELDDEGVSENRGDSNLAMALKACLQSKFPNNYDGDIFLLWVCHEYQTLCSASRRLAPILEELEVTHLKNFNLTWELVNRHLFRSIVYSDSTLLLQIQRCCLNCSCALHLNIEQNFSQKTSSHVWPSQSSKCSSPSNGSSGTHGGVECPTLARFSKLDDEMTVINVVYREAMNLIEEFNKRQMVQAKQRFKDWESFHVQWKMMEQEVLNKKNAFAKAFYQKSLLQCQNNNSQTTPDTPMTDTIQLPSNNLNLPNTGGSNNCKNLGILNLNEDALIKLMSSNETVSGSSSNCSSSPSSSCSSSSESSSASSMLSPGAVVEIQQGGEDLKLLLQEITKLNSSEILPKQVTDLLINSAGLVSQSSSSSIPVSVPSNSPDKVATFTGVKCEGTPTPTSTGCLRKHRGDVSPSFFSSQHKNPRSDINSFRRNEYLNLYNPVKIKSSLPLHTTQSVLDKNKDSPIELNSSCECHDCLTQKNPTFNLLPSTENTNSSSSSVSPPSTAPPPVGSYPLLPNHLSEIARSAASHLASKALIHPHLYNLHARKAAKSNSAVVLEANKKPAAEFGQSPIPGISHQSSPGSGTNSIDFELVAKEVFREQVKLAAQGEWSLDIVKNKVAEAVMGNLGITNNQANGSNSTSLGSLTSPNSSGCIQSKNFFSPIQRTGKGSTTPRSRSGSSGDISNSPGTPSPTTSHNVGTQSDALPPGGSPLKTTQGTSCAMGGPANSNIPSGKNRNAPNSSTETLKVNGNSKPFSVTESSTPTLNQRDQVVMTEGSASVAVGTTAQSSECQMTARHNHHHHHHSRDQCCESVLPPNGAGNYTEGDESGLDDSCSERSSSTSTSNPRESRVCDCCYCEVFGHGVPVVAPVSRNYPEMRERLRLRLSKRKAEGSAGSSKTTQHLSNSPSSNNLPDNLPLVTDKNSHGKLATSADDRELDALLRYINGTDLDPESEAAHLHQDHQHGCSGNCRKPVNGTTRISSTKAANKKQRKKAKKAIIDEKNLDKKESISPPIRETFHANRENTRESLHRDVKKVRSASPPFESRVINDINNIPQVSKPQLKATRMSENAKGARTRLLEEESGPIKALANRAVSNDENLSNFKNKNGKLVSQSRSKTPVSNQPLLNEEDLHREISPIATLAKELVNEKEHVVVSGPKKNSSRLNGIVPVSVINNAPIRNISSNTQSNTAPAPLRTKKNKKKKNCVEDSSSLDEVFLPKDIDLDNGELDEVEKELEAFKRFCMASVPLANKEKVHVNLKDIVIKKKVNNTNDKKGNHSKS